MSVLLRLGAFVVALALVFGVATLAGAQLDPPVDEAEGEHPGTEEDMGGHTEMTTNAGAGGTGLPGLAVAAGGLQLVPEQTTLGPGDAVSYRFRVVGQDGETVREFDIEHQRRMHLILVRRDFVAFQHLHPRQLDDGSWEAEADLREPGVYRVFADFATAGRSLTLAADLFVPGDFRPQPLPASESTDAAGGGYEAALDSETPRAGGTTALEFTVSRNGERVSAVEPYLGADGHLVALREHDQAFLHTHPQGEPGGSGPISFAVEYPTPGRYRLFLQFKHEGEVRTVAFTQGVGEVSPGADASPEPQHEEDEHGH